ncbi:hypothetical protein [Nannocystis radixulma]|uniref:Benenodin family lasso peptide n=1 Tax=Nannocystis radixulma TaxID=2995305 RepID=A0ABT5BPM5_9BACT|nr:hypothetical protein [Nannocystis radixulma]MDC0676047.1 hypothetical protein [Nannocystis radixulma]
MNKTIKIEDLRDDDDKRELSDEALELVVGGQAPATKTNEGTGDTDDYA